MRPSNKTWSLTVRARWLHLDAPHGSFRVRDVAPEVRLVIEALPDGTDVECEGSFDGGATITHLVVTKIRRILKDMTGRIMSLPDAIVAADGRLALARARTHFTAGNLDAAAADVGALLRIGDDQAIGEYERLPATHQQGLLPALVEWQAARDAAWRPLRHVPIERWTDAHLDDAFQQALANGGVFGAAPGVRAEAILDELARRELPTATQTKQLKKLRKAQSTEGDTFHRIATDLDDARVIGADAHGIYIAGTAKLGESIELKGAFRERREDRHAVIAQYALDGSELRRWHDVAADRVVDGVALRMEDDPAGIRLADGKVLYRFAYRIAHADGELLWGIHERDEERRTMRSEVRRIATGEVIAKYREWIDDLAWDGTQIALDPSPPETLAIETARGTITIPYAHAPWQFRDWHTIEAGGWIVHYDGVQQLYLAPAERDATWVVIDFAKAALAKRIAIDLAPPWLAFRRKGEPILLVALAELASALEIRVDGRRFVKRSARTPELAVAPALVAWYEALVAAGVAPALSAVARDALLFGELGDTTTVPDDAIARVLVDRSPCCIDHRDQYVDEDDPLFADMSRVLDVRVREVERTQSADAADYDDEATFTLTIEVTRDGKTARRMTDWSIDSVAVAVDKMLDKLGSARRLFAVTRHQWSRHVFLAITRAQRQALIAAGVKGIGASAASTDRADDD